MTDTEIIPDQPPPDPLRRFLIADCLALFALFGFAALWTPHDWLRLPDTIAAVASLTAAGHYWLDRNF